jgi:hypothetical protein
MFRRRFNINRKEAKEFEVEKANFAKISQYASKCTQIPDLRNHEVVMNVHR